jgi:hypothetical protein
MKYLLALALIFLLIGLAIMGSSFILKTTYKNEYVDTKENANSISGNFKAGEKIIVEFTPGENWSTVIYPENDKYMYICFNITGLTTKNTTMFEVELYRPNVGYTPYIYRIRLLKHGSLQVNVQSDNQTTEIGGVVTLDDEYMVSVNYIIPGTAGLPLTLTLWRGKPLKSQPYGWLFLPGILIIALSFALLVYYNGKRKRLKMYRRKGLKMRAQGLS